MKFYLKNITLSATLSFLFGSLLITSPVFAAAVIDPTTEPASVAAPYALSDTDLASGTEKAYRPWFENGAWQGDLVQYNLSAGGSLSTSIDLSTSPPTDDGTTPTNWSARLQFTAAATADANFWKTNAAGGARKIFTSTTGSNQVEFDWANLTSIQKGAVDNAAALASAPSSDILDYIRGDRSNETDATPTPGTLRKRFSLMADIVHSNPVYVAAPAASFTFPGYSDYKNNDQDDATTPGQADRTGLVFVGANDGMLHAFNASTGDEVYAYVPSMVFSRLKRLAADPYVHTYFVDGELSVGDLDYDTASGPDWRTILAAGLGSGGKGMYVLDVTHASIASPNTTKLLKEFTGNNFGYIHGKAEIALLNDSKWYVIQGNGYNSVNDVAKLILIDTSGTVTTIATDASITNNGLSSPALVDINSDGKPDYAYAGDIQGNLWKFNLTAKTSIKLFVTGVNQPITSVPDIARHPNGGILVYFGTGSLLSGPNTASADTSNTDTQAFYAIRDNNAVTTILNDGNILNQPLTEVSYAAGTIIRYSTNNTAIDWNTNTGWKVPFPTSGERLVGDPQLRAGRLQFVTTSFNPDMSPIAWLMELDYLNGGDAGNVLFDLNIDAIRDGVDTVNRPFDVGTGLPIGTGNIPIAIKYGASGVFSQPAIARINNFADTLLINGLLMPVPAVCSGSCIGGFIGGHVDVDTDSYRAGITTQKDPGLGGETNGHFHQYDKHHGVVFTDYFNLEPRRDLVTLSFDKDESADPTKLILEAKLNRITEVCDPNETNADCQSNTTAGKLFGSNTGTPKSGDKKFFIVLANADINSGATITIGAKTWDVQDYQDMITPLILGKANADVSSDVGFVDDESASLIFTMNSIKAAGGNTGTLRIAFDNRAILSGGVHPTITGCVKGGDDPYLVSASTKSAPEVVSSNPLLLSGLSDAHITNAQETGVTGYRWRNGALTLQIIDATNYKLQPAADMPRDDSTGDSVAGAHAFYYTQTAFANNGDNITIGLADNTAPTQDSGLLYESTTFNHYGDLYELVRTGGPVDAPCYGASKYSSSLGIERKGLTVGEYNTLTAAFSGNQALQDQFAALLAAYENASSATLDATKAALQAFVDANGLNDYMKYRSYIGKLIPSQQLLEWDKVFVDPTTTVSPATVQDGTKDDSQLGQNFRTGQRTWIDLTP